MAMTVELWEDSGPITSGHGTTRIEVDNIGWKNSALSEIYTFADYPITRPLPPNIYRTSFKKYNYFKIYGTYESAFDMEIRFNGTPVGSGNGSGTASKVKVFYKWSSTYAVPTTSLLNGTLYDPANPIIMKPLLSTTGPEGTALWTPTLATNTTYYTPYLITQLFVEPSEWDDYGNLNSTLELEIKFKESKTGLPNYDPELVNWEW